MDVRVSMNVLSSGLDDYSGSAQEAIKKFIDSFCRALFNCLSNLNKNKKPQYNL